MPINIETGIWRGFLCNLMAFAFLLILGNNSNLIFFNCINLCNFFRPGNQGISMFFCRYVWCFLCFVFLIDKVIGRFLDSICEVSDPKENYMMVKWWRCLVTYPHQSLTFVPNSRITSGDSSTSGLPTDSSHTLKTDSPLTWASLLHHSDP